MTVPFTNAPNSATISTTETSLVTPTVGPAPRSSTTAVKALWIYLDLAAVTASDEFSVKVYETLNASATGGTAGSQRLVDTFTFNGLSGPIAQLGPYTFGEGWDVTITKTAGNDRIIVWSLREDVGDVNTATIGGTATTSIAAAVMASVVEGTETVTQTLRLITAFLFGVGTVADDGSSYIAKALDGIKTRVAGTWIAGARAVATRDGT